MSDPVCPTCGKERDHHPNFCSDIWHKLDWCQIYRDAHRDAAIRAVASVVQLRGKRWSWTPPRHVREDLAARMIAAYESYRSFRSG